jgi:hypothetical protein
MTNSEKITEHILGTIQGILKESAGGLRHPYISPETGCGITTPGFMSWNSLAGLF